MTESTFLRSIFPRKAIIHQPDTRRFKKLSHRRRILSSRSLANLRHLIPLMPAKRRCGSCRKPIRPITTLCHSIAMPLVKIATSRTTKLPIKFRRTVNGFFASRTTNWAWTRLTFTGAKPTEFENPTAKPLDDLAWEFFARTVKKVGRDDLDQYLVQFDSWRDNSKKVRLLVSGSARRAWIIQDWTCDYNLETGKFELPA